MKVYTLKGINLRPLTKMRLIGERDAEKRNEIHWGLLHKETSVG
jgi:hypothetical protein